MQTFLPYPSYERSADALDPRRLNKQILECVQIAKALTGETTSWSNHCVTRMWREAPKGVVLFGLACCKEYRKRPQTRGHHKSEVELVRLLSVCERNGMTENYPRWFNRHKVTRPTRNTSPVKTGTTLTCSVSSRSLVTGALTRTASGSCAQPEKAI